MGNKDSGYPVEVLTNSGGLYFATWSSRQPFPSQSQERKVC